MNIYDKDFFKDENNIIVVQQLVSTNIEHQDETIIEINSFDNVDEVVEYTKGNKAHILKVLYGREGEDYKSNIYYKRLNKEEFIKYLIVFKSDWLEYSKQKRKNRFKRLLDW